MFTNLFKYQLLINSFKYYITEKSVEYEWSMNKFILD